jgi:hypothetical protein
VSFPLDTWDGRAILLPLPRSEFESVKHGHLVMSFTQFSTNIPVDGKGHGHAFAVIDYGEEHNLIWGSRGKLKSVLAQS